MSTDSLDGRTVVVTGAARGLGHAIAARVAASGATLVLVDRAADPLAAAAGELAAAAPGRVHSIVADISDPQQVAAIFEQHPAPWGLVNNAALADGVGGLPFWDIDDADWRHLMSINIDGTFSVAKHAVRSMIAGGVGGRIINMASDAALYGSPRLAHYVASKGAIIALTRTMARDLGPHGVTVNSVSPGLTVGPSAETIPEERHYLYEFNRALTRPQQPSDIVGIVNFLLGDESAYITGHNVVVDGGFVMG